MVMGHVRKVVGSNPGAIYWMDIDHIDLLYCLFKKTKNKQKEAGYQCDQKKIAKCL